MAVTSVRDFVQLVEKSKLLSPAQLAELRDWPEQEPNTLAARMVRADWITKWQAQQFLAGKSQFFLGRYKLLELIGVGGMGAVFKAVQPGIGRTVALKVMSKHLLKQSRSVTRFLREIRSAAVLDHPNIVRAYDADCSGDTYFLVMEFVTGRNLKSWIKKEQSLPVGWSCECIRQAALGLEHAYEQGMVHRDIKPSNLLVTQHADNGLPLVKILDMGLARFASETQDEGDLTRSGQVLGTPDYIAPEQARNTKTADIRADIFSLGCALFELLTGRLPFPGETVMEKLMARASQDAFRVRLYRPDVSPELDAVIARMLSRDPQTRYGTPIEVAQALAPFAIGTAGNLRSAPQPADPPPASPPPGSTDDHRDDTFAAFEIDFDGALGGLAADFASAAEESGAAPDRNSSGYWWRQTPVRITAGIVAVLFVAGLVGSMLPGPKGGPVEPNSNHTRIKKKTKTAPDEEADDEPEGDAAKDPERDAALWVLQKTGTVVVAESDGSSRQEVGRAGDLPKGALHVIAVSLHEKVRVGQPDFQRLAKLKRLESLDLADTRFDDADLALLKELTTLNRLELQDTPLTNAGIGFLKGLQNLHYLDLGRTQVAGPELEVLSALKSLTNLSLEGTGVGDPDLKPLATIPHLQILNLAGTGVKGPGLQSIRGLKELTNLDLGGLNLGAQGAQNNGLVNLRGLSQIRYLRLTGSRVTDGDLALLTGMTGLKELLLGSTGVSSSGLKNLTWMTGLERLDLKDTVVGDEGLKALREMSSLKAVNLEGTAVSDVGMEQLYGMRRIEHLVISGTNVTPQGFDALKKALPNCKVEY